MNTLAEVFINNLVPIILATAAGYPLGKWLKISPRPLSQVSFYIFSPCLIFTILVDSKLTSDSVLNMVLFTLLVAGIMGLLTFGAGKLLKLERSMLAAVMLTTLFVNAGNFGLPVSSFALGDQGLAHASLFFLTNSLIMYTFGTIIASSGTASLKESLVNLFKLPILYAMLLGILFASLRWTLPLPLDRTVRLLSGAAIPSMLVMLGMQLQNVQWKGNITALALSNSLRLLVGPALGIFLTALLRMSGPAYQAAVLQSAMPSAVLTTVLATEYDAQPAFVTSAVYVSTLLSPLVLTPLLILLTR